MAQDYEAIRETVRLAGESKLQQLDEAFQEQQAWFHQAAEQLRAEAARHASKQPGRATRKQGLLDKVQPASVLSYIVTLPKRAGFLYESF